MKLKENYESLKKNIKNTSQILDIIKKLENDVLKDIKEINNTSKNQMSDNK